MSAARLAIRSLGELLVTAGIMVLLFCAYQLFWTNVEAGRAQASTTDRLLADWRRGGGVDLPSVPGATASGRGTPAPTALPDIPLGKALARMYLPRIDVVVPVVEGVKLSDLARGVGHYPRTGLPGQIGNFSVAGHRATNGEPFRALDRLRPGDPVVVETRDSWLTYVVDRTRIVSPSAVGVVLPVPNRPGVRPTRRLMTLTTCHPRWASYLRMIVFTHLGSAQPKSAGRPAALADAG